jgi:alpha-D-ribose 1-methylphosphonate 5-triphosphate synthase subunit PhnG
MQEHFCYVFLGGKKKKKTAAAAAAVALQLQQEEATRTRKSLKCSKLAQRTRRKRAKTRDIEADASSNKFVPACFKRRKLNKSEKRRQGSLAGIECGS